MANKINEEESNPLIARNDFDGANNDDNHVDVDLDAEKKKNNNLHFTPPAAEIPVSTKSVDSSASELPVWTADGFPVPHGSVMGEPMRRNQWDSSLLSCLGRNDEFCSSDLEVCLLGSLAPCILYGTNAERLGLGSAPGAFANHCLTYTGLYLIGNSLFGWNSLAPVFSYHSRTALRRTFNLEGSFEALGRSCGCCGSCVADESQLERCETSCDFATHFFCHTCALCQEGRELRRRLPHPGFNAQSVMVMLPPGEQTMGRGAA